MNLERAIALIKEFEGCSFVSYQDTGGVWTVGYGATLGVGPDMQITREEADEWLERDCETSWEGVRSCVKVPLSENQACALVAFAYNVGVGNFKRSTLLRKLNWGDYLGAAEELPRWNKDGGRVVAGLTRRRLAEQTLFLQGTPPPSTADGSGSNGSSA